MSRLIISSFLMVGATLIPDDNPVSYDMRVWWFSLAAILLTSVVTGFGPALTMLGSSTAERLKDSAGTRACTPGRLRRWLVTTELALARKPMVVGYKLGWLTYLLARPFIHVSSIVLINLVLKRQAVPEFIQSACTPEALAQAVKPLLVDQQARAKQLRDLDEANRAFGLGGESPSERAARTVLAIARKRSAEPVPA